MISVAPMMGYTDRHCRYFMRLIAPDVRLYTEMITTYALLHGDPNRLLYFHPNENYLALQLGGSDPKDLATCAKLGEEFGYREINLNVGCPSERVKKGRFGACLMLEPQLVADCVAAMQANISIPVTVKCRIGVDQQDDYHSLYKFIELLDKAGCKTIIIHARKAWLKGLSPKQNRDIPPLCYEVVHQIKKDFPQLTVVINGGIKTLDEIDAQLKHVDGVMIGRAAYSNPYLLAEIENKIFLNKKNLSRQEIIEKLLDYAHDELNKSVKLHAITRHILGLFQGQAGAAKWRRYLSEGCKADATIDIIGKALVLVENKFSFYPV